MLLATAPPTPARVSYGYSEIFSIDTVSPVDDAASCLPQAIILSTIYPNPFNPRVTIVVELAEAATFELAIFDLRGRLVRVIDSGPLPGGRYQTTWDGQDDAGRAVSAGSYVCRLDTPLGSQTRKLTLAR